VFSPESKAGMVQLKDDINRACERIVWSTYALEEEAKEVQKEIQVLLSSIADLANPLKNLPMGHVMISYNWSCQPLAIELEKRLKLAGYPTWFDLNDMESDINESMANAVQRAWLVVVLFNKKYKESPNCRKECEMSDGLGKNMLFIKVESTYHQEAWLNLLMGKALWILCEQVEKVPEVWSQIQRRIEMVAHPRKASVAPGEVVDLKRLSISSMGVGGGGDPNMQILMDMVKELKSGQDELKKAMEDMKKKMGI
jgi:hypothetical protein